VLLIVQELAAGGEMFSHLMNCGALSEDIARFYFQQLIAGSIFFFSFHPPRPSHLILFPSLPLSLSLSLNQVWSTSIPKGSFIVI
jgi:hypothetical protein